MHTVLDAQHVILDATLKESLKHTATVLRIISILREDCCRQLLLITHQDNLAWLMLERNQVSQFDGLAGLIHD